MIKFIVIASVFNLYVYYLYKEKNRDNSIAEKNLELQQRENSILIELEKSNFIINETFYPIFEKSIEASIAKMFSNMNTEAVDQKIKKVDFENNMSESQRAY